MANVNVNVSINASGSQAGSQAFVQSTTAMFNAITALGPQVNTLNGNLSHLIQTLNQCSQANQNAGNSFGAFLGADLAADLIRDFTSALKELVVESTLYAARTEELGVALSAISKASGESTRVIAQQEFAMKQLNITTQDARQTIARFIQADLDLSKSGALARTAQDLAVIAGFSTSEEINKLVIGIQTLQSRNLRTAGVFLTVDEVLDRLAKTTNRARDSFSTFEKQQAVLNAVLEFGARVTGTYEAAMETASKQIRSLERLIFEAQNAIGNHFIPILNLAVKAVSALFIFIEQHPKTFLILSTGAALVGASFLILNTRLFDLMRQITALTVIGFVRMIASLRIFNVNVVAATTAVNTFTGATIAATGAAVGFQAVLGGFAAITGIVALIIGIAGAMTGIEEPAEKFNKITDTQIIQSGAYIRSIQERRKALEDYRNALELTNQRPEILETQPALYTVRTTTSEVGRTQNVVDDLQKQISALRAEESDISERIARGLKKDIIEEAGALSQLLRARNQNNESLTVQQDKLEQAVKANQDAQTARKNAIDQLRALSGGNEGLILTTAEVSTSTERYVNILKELSPNEKAVLEVQDQRLSVVDRLSQALNILEKREAAVLNARIAGLVSNIRLFKAEEDSRTAAINANEQQLVQLQNQLAVYEKLKAAGQTQVAQGMDPGVEGSAQQYTSIGDAIKETNDQITAMTKVIGENGTSLDESQGKLAEQYRQLLLVQEQFGGTTLELYELLHGLGLFPGTLDQFSKAFQEAEIFMRGFKEQADKVALGINAVQEQMKNLRFPSGTLVTPDEELGVYVKNLENQRQAFIEDLQRRQNLSREAAQQLFETDPQIQERFVKQFDQGFKKTSEFIRKEFGDNIGEGLDAALRENAFDDETKVRALFLGLFKTFDEIQAAAKKAAREGKTEFQRMTETLERTEEQIKSFLNVGSAEFKLRLRLEEAERTKKDLEAIFNLRYRLGIPLNIPIKREDVQKTRLELEVLAKVFDEIREANNAVLAARLNVGAPIINAQLRAETQLLKLVKDRRNEEQQLAADIAVSINRRIQLESDAANVRRLEAKAFLEILNEEQATRENAVTALTRIQIRQGKFSQVDQNAILQEGLKVANNPVVAGLNDTQKVITASVDAINKTQVDFGKALGESVTRGGDAVRVTVDRKISETNTILRNHTDLLQSIRDKETSQYSAGGITVAEGTSSPSFASLEELFQKHFPQIDTSRLGREGSRIDPNQVHYGKTGSYRVGDLIVADLRDAIKKGLDPLKIYRQTVQESHYNPFAESGTGAVGLKQITGRTGKSLGVPGDLRFDPYKAIEAGNRLMVENLNIAKRLAPQADDLQKYAIALSLYVDGIEAYNKANGDLSKMRQTPGYLRAAGVNLPKTPQGPQTAFDYTQQFAQRGEGIPIVQSFIDALSGRGSKNPQQSRTTIFNKLRDTLGITDGLGQAKLFDTIGTEEGIKGSVRAAEELQTLRTTLAERRANLEVRKLIGDQLDVEHLKNLQLEDDEQQFQRLQDFRITKQFELAKQERELESLRSGGIALQETLHEAAMERLNAEIEAEKQFIKTQEEVQRRTDPTKRAHDVTLLLRKEYDQRIKDELDMDDRITVLRQQVDDKYFTSLTNRRRVEKQGIEARLQEHVDLTNQLIELDDQLAHQTENSALRYSVTWKEAILEVQNRHEDAVHRILRAQASIADQTTVDTARIRATVLENINQIPGVSESIGGLFNDTFKVYSDDIDKWIDKTTEKMGNLGKIFNSFFKSVSQRALGSIQNSILDAIFPPTPEELAAKEGIKIGGLDQAEAAFTQLEATTLALGQVNMNTAQVTVETATALNGLTGAASVASNALIQIGSVVAGVSQSGGGGLGTGGLGGLLNTSIGGGSTGSGSLPSLLRGISNIGLGGLGSNSSSAGASAIASIFGGVPGLSFGGGSASSSVGTLLQTLSNQPLSTTNGPLATLSGAVSGGGGGIKGVLSNLFGSGFGGKGGLLSLFSKGGLKSLAGGLAPQLPFLGLGLGASLGAPSRGGGILGGIGGGILGLGVAGGLGASGLVGGLAGVSGLGASLFGALGLGGLSTSIGTAAAGSALAPIAGLLSFAVPAALIAAPLLIGAYFLGRKKQRGRDEKSRDELKGDAFSQIDAILKNVRADRMDGIDGIIQAEAIRDQYFQQISSLKTKSVRKSAENYRPYFDSKIEAIRREADLQLQRKEISDRLVPEFAFGGTVRRDDIIKVQPGERILPPGINQRLAYFGGTVPGANRGIDDTYMWAMGDTTVVPSPRRNTDIQRGLSLNNSSKTPIVVNLNVTAEIDPDGMVRVGMASAGNQQLVVNTVNQGISDRRVNVRR